MDPPLPGSEAVPSEANGVVHIQAPHTGDQVRDRSNAGADPVHAASAAAKAEANAKPAKADVEAKPAKADADAKPAEEGAKEAKAEANEKHIAMDAAAERFADLSKKLGGPMAVKEFFAAYGTEGFAPAKKSEDKKDETAKDAKKLADDQKIDTTLKDHSKDELDLPTAPKGYGATYLTQDWGMKAITPPENPTTLDQSKWQIVMQSNSMMQGFRILENGTLVRARHPAFQLKPIAVTSPATTEPNFKPDFEVFDASSISIKETTSELEKSMVENGFSSLAISGSVSGGAFGYAAAASFGYNHENATSSNTGDFESRKEFTATYTFPRARVFLDEYNLQLTPECKDWCSRVIQAWTALGWTISQNQEDFVNKVLDMPGQPIQVGIFTIPNPVKSGRDYALAISDKFFARFGHIFSTSFQLGGQLIATRAASSIAGTTDTQRRDAMKAAAALSVSSPYVSGSISASGENTSSSKSHDSTVDGTSTLGWSARGGNTLLCANPPEWANSVGDSKTWRVIEQAETSFLPSLIGRLDPTDDLARGQTRDEVFANTEACFAVLASLRTKLNDRDKRAASQATGSNTWTGRIKLVAADGRSITIRNERLTLGSGVDETIFTVLDGDITNTAKTPSLEQLHADSPVFLVANKASPSRDGASQILGCYADDEGSLKTQNSKEADGKTPICRWSFRLRPSSSKSILNVLPNFQKRWQPGKIPIQNNDSVVLFCHSYDSGSFRTSSEPANYPYWAPAVMTKDGVDTLSTQNLSTDDLLNNRLFQDHLGTSLHMESTAVKALMDRWNRGIEISDETRIVDQRRAILGMFDGPRWRENVARFTENPDGYDKFDDSDRNYDLDNDHPDWAVQLMADNQMQLPDWNHLWDLGMNSKTLMSTTLRDRMYSTVIRAIDDKKNETTLNKVAVFKIVYVA